VEDAEAVARHDAVIFADAADAGPEPFSFRELTRTEECGFSTHSVRPEVVLGLARQMFQARTRAYVLAIRGYEFNEFAERLSEGARRNLAEAEQFIARAIPALLEGRDVAGRPGQGVGQAPACPAGKDG
jgi:hydrogenase maturation protease